MNKTIVLLLLCLLTVFAVQAQEAQKKQPNTNTAAPKTFILLRHAEREQNLSADPELSAHGQQQAEALAQLLKDQQVSAVYATPYRRTINTAAPLVAQKGLNTQFYEPIKAADLLEQLKSSAEKGAIILVGHSNTIPSMVNALMGDKVVSPIAEDDYGQVYIVTLPAAGPASLVTLRLPEKK
ncbi:phosphoglycerate mutase family protein [Cesiribacter sp. SM1]|uniref:phosphoglycerate mutase family protein n=1 Tax=Cesiribacter sp. SM1 TaxID=2861196 RepID=UPI001CD319D3|nr:phosphoglycerate mutase family protein [Cesiribacter sp. SM1]